MIFVNRKNYSTAVGLELTIFGGFFDDDCSVLFGSILGNVLDVNEDSIVVSVPESAGRYDLKVDDGHGNIVDVGSVNVSTLSDFECVGGPKNYKFKDFLGYVCGLLPKMSGVDVRVDFKDPNDVSVSNKVGGSVFGKLFWALAFAVSVVFEYIRELYAAINPVNTTNIDAWENELLLPIKGFNFTSTEKRKMEILRAACTEGGCCVGYFRKILRIIGVDAEIFEYWKNPEQFGEIPVSEDERNFYWMIRISGGTPDVHTLKCTGKCNKPLRWWTDSAVRNLFEKIKPAHTRLLYAYSDAGYWALPGDDGLWAMPDGGKWKIPLTIGG